MVNVLSNVCAGVPLSVVRTITCSAFPLTPALVMRSWLPEMLKSAWFVPPTIEYVKVCPVLSSVEDNVPTTRLAVLGGG